MLAIQVSGHVTKLWFTGDFIGDFNETSWIGSRTNTLKAYEFN